MCVESFCVSCIFTDEEVAIAKSMNTAQTMTASRFLL